MNQNKNKNKSSKTSINLRQIRFEMRVHRLRFGKVKEEGGQTFIVIKW